MAVSEAQRRSNARYRKRSMKMVQIGFYPKDMYLWEYLQTKNNRTEFLKGLIKAEYNKENEGQ